MQRLLLDLSGDLQHLRRTAQLSQHAVCRFLENRGSRVEVLVDAVPEPHQPGRVVAVLASLEERLAAAFVFGDFVQHFDHSLIGAAVERAPQRVDCSSRGGVDVRL